jgi:hypothetical protein
MIPNIKTLTTPLIGEMGDYYTTPDMDSASLAVYSLRSTDIYCRHQPFKKIINSVDLGWYRLRIALCCIAAIVFLAWRKKTSLSPRAALIILLLFITAYFALMLYSSCFVVRYMVAANQLITLFLILVSMQLFGKKAVRTD